MDPTLVHLDERLGAGHVPAARNAARGTRFVGVRGQVPCQVHRMGEEAVAEATEVLRVGVDPLPVGPRGEARPEDVSAAAEGRVKADVHGRVPDEVVPAVRRVAALPYAASMSGNLVARAG